MNELPSIQVWPYFSKIKVILFDKDATPPTRKYEGDAGIDFYALKDTVLQPFSVKNVRTGVGISIPFGFFGLLKAKGRSNFLVGAGVIDHGYQGEVIFKLFNPTEEQIVIRSGQAIGQLILIPIIMPEVVICSEDEFLAEKTLRGPSGGIHEV